jgi:hypothetical protein
MKNDLFWSMAESGLISMISERRVSRVSTHLDEVDVHPVGVSMHPVEVGVHPVGVSSHLDGVSVHPIGVSTHPGEVSVGTVLSSFRFAKDLAQVMP